MRRRLVEVVVVVLPIYFAVQAVCVEEGGDTGTAVRCPPGWYPAGPLCVAVFNGPPYTECPTNFKRFKATSPYRGGMWVTEPGVCGLLKVFSPDLVCPDLYELDIQTDTQGGLSATCEPTPGNGRRLAGDTGGEFDGGGTGPHPENEDGEPVPDVSCPDGYTYEALPVNDYAWKNRRFLRCTKVVRYLGEIWCPDNFTPYGEGIRAKVVEDANSQYDDTAGTENDGSGNSSQRRRRRLGDDGETTGDDGGIPWHEKYFDEVTKDSFLSQMPEWLIPYLKGYTGCAQVVGVPAEKCDEFACRSSYISEQKKILTRWVHRQLGFDDEDLFVYEAIPTGNDLRWTR